MNTPIAAGHSSLIKPVQIPKSTASILPTTKLNINTHVLNNNNNIIIESPNSIESYSKASIKEKPKVLCCDKCDGKHETDDCPYYKKKRDDHPGLDLL